MRREEFEAIALAGGERARELMVALLDQVAEVAALRERLEELERQVNRDSGNSSMPPSSDPPASRAERRRAAREAYKRSMRKSGGQPGDQGKTRELVAAQRIVSAASICRTAVAAGTSSTAASSASATRSSISSSSCR